MALRINRPTYFLSVLWLGCLAACSGTVWLALQQPWLGVQLAGDDKKVRVVVDYSQQISIGAEVKRFISATEEEFDLDPFDLSDNTQLPKSFDEARLIYKKQQQMNAALYRGDVRLAWCIEGGKENIATFHPHTRPLSSLPNVFWFMLIVSSASFMISCWVFLLRPQNWGARMFALTGVSLFVSGLAGAYLSAFEIALSEQTQRISLGINYGGVFLFGSALIALFLSYPRQLVKPRSLLWIPAVFSLWFLAEQLEMLPSPIFGIFTAMPIFLLITFIVTIVQWRHTDKRPLERAALRWFILSVFVACTLFMLTNVLPLMLSTKALLPVGYAFGFLLIMYVGIALGLRRYRLFDIDEWSYRVLLWVSGATLVIVLDALLIFSGVVDSASLGITLLVCGWLYFPLRQWLWQRIVKKHFPKFDSLLPEISAVAFTASHSEQKIRWESFLMRVFDPLEMKQGDAGNKNACVLEEGLALQVPACATLPPYTLRYAGRGIRLFSTRDADFAMALSQLLHQVMGGRTSYEQGVAQERLRIGRDLHDNIGARLLKLIHHLRGTPDADIARDAMKDLRTSIAAMDSQPVPLRDAIADWRAEANSRCEVAKCRLSWDQAKEVPEIDLPPRMKGMLESVMREVITNALKHASPQSIQVAVKASEIKMRVDVENDGDIADPLTWQDGYGLRNIRGRMAELGGNLNISSSEGKVRLTLTVPLS